MKFPSVAVIIPNWNGKKLLQVCLRSLENQTYNNFEIVVVDNGSTDGSVEFLKSKYPQVKIIKFEKNLGFAKAVNEGIKTSKSKYILLLNNDTKIDKHCLKLLVNVLNKQKDICAVAPKVVSFYNPKIIDSAGDTMNVVGQAFHRGWKEKSFKWNTPGEIFLCTAGACLYRRRAFSKIGLFDESFFIYSEDVDWCLRGQLVSCQFWYEPKAIVYHRHKATTGKRMPKFFEYLRFRNMNLTIIKDFPWQLFLKRWRFLTIPLVHFNTIMYMALHGLFKEALLADLWILSHLPQTLRKRWKIQKTRKVSINYLDNQMEPKKIRLYGLLK